MAVVDKRALLDRYEAAGGEERYEQAKALYEAALAAAPDDPLLLRDYYGYLLECHRAPDRRRGDRRLPAGARARSAR
jgi:hypothetical protein